MAFWIRTKPCRGISTLFPELLTILTTCHPFGFLHVFLNPNQPPYASGSTAMTHILYPHIKQFAICGRIDYIIRSPFISISSSSHSLKRSNSLKSTFSKILTPHNSSAIALGNVLKKSIFGSVTSINVRSSKFTR